jgi:uncharacterized protein (TIGR00369 family)
MTELSTTTAVPALDAGSLEAASAFLLAAGLVLDEITGTRVTGHVLLGPEHHTPWGIVHGGVYSTAIESVASVGASTAMRGQGLVAVGLTNTTHFLRSVSGGRVNVEAAALSQGRTQQLWRADITDEPGRLIAHGEVRLQNVPGRSLSSPGIRCGCLAHAARRAFQSKVRLRRAGGRMRSMRFRSRTGRSPAPGMSGPGRPAGRGLRWIRALRLIGCIIMPRIRH